MYPVLLEFRWAAHVLVIRSYDVALVLAWLAVWLVGGALSVRRGLPMRRVLVSLLVITLASFVGARLGHWFLNPSFYRGAPERLWHLSTGAFSIWGVVLFGSLAGWLACHWLRLDPWGLADALAPALAVGYMVAKIGCFLNGCCCGRPTDLPWGVTFPVGTAAYWQQAASTLFGFLGQANSVHPSQLYEVLTGLIAFSIAVLALWRRTPNGVPALTSAICLVVGRATVGTTRVASLQTCLPAWQTVSFYAIGLVVLATLLAWRLFRNMRKKDG